MSNETGKVYTGDSKVLRFFEELSAIPRASSSEKAVSDFVASFARERGCEVLQDDRWNLIIRKPAAAGYESAPIVIFQGHLDMVCEKNKTTVHDFAKDPIRFKIDGDMIYADGTTLGADNGIAVATAMAIIDAPDMAHPELEILLTTEEETSMGGAFHLDASPLKGRMMINFDSDREGILFVSSAGGINTFHSVPVAWEEAGTAAGAPYTISVQGLMGGHSGDDIIHERGNANKLLGRVLDDLRRHADFALAGVSGGMKVNAIPREAEAAVYLSETGKAAAEARIAELNRILKDEFQASDKGAEVVLQVGFDESGAAGAAASSGKAFTEDVKLSVIRLLTLIPNGVLSMDKAIGNLVRTSSNLGVVSVNDTHIVMQSLSRSSMRSQVDEVVRAMRTVAEAVGCEFREDHYFPGWPYRADSKLRPVVQEAFEQRFGKPIEIKAIHAGLECGVLIEKMPDLDAVSFGPNMYEIHTPDEHLSISSVERTWPFLVDVLGALKG
ncbi:aminoacyl-histidine dipeptidase [Paenibacillus rhizovicinus]|uniref:Cytosol non-specific dipeptidase n=1 Tax=Paenibacillus rhizovicinus TaxID=2704463 RepID=A0A6C0P3G4_9BACL|nr:aminoacyl-histidine dipeptidase [Paenibacillus rhizovicinus]QHW32881.1 aminoacyl-histidine dipeptidase [Paenibacillus rhizovicinus]